MSAEYSMWALLGLLLFVIVGIIVFLKRNQLAKTDRDPQPQERPNKTGVAPLIETRKQ